MSDVKYNVFFRPRDQRYVLSYVPPGGSWKRPRQVTAPESITSERKAKAWADGELVRIRQGGGVHPTKRKGAQTLRDVHVRLMKVREDHPDTKKATLSNNWTHLRAQILAADLFKPPASIADTPMAEVDVARARAFVRAVRARVSPNHCRNVWSTAKVLWDTAHGEGLITTANPFKNKLVRDELPRQRGKGSRLEPIIVPLAAVQAVADATDDVVPLERRVRTLVAAACGLDEGELAGLQWKHAIIAADVVHPFLEVRQSLSTHGRNGFSTVDTTKTTNRNRDVPMHPAVVAALTSWRGAWEMYVGRRPKLDDFVFVWTSGKARGRPQRHKDRASLLRADLTAVCALALREERAPIEPTEIPEVTWKALRRTFSSALKNADVSEEDRGKLMGHAGESVTARNYTRHELVRLADLVARIPLQWNGAVEPARNGGGARPIPNASPIPESGDTAENQPPADPDDEATTTGEPFAKPTYVSSNLIRTSERP